MAWDGIRYSIIIPCYNASKFIQRPVDSVLSQTRDDYEVIIVDDGSTDNTPGIIESYVSRRTNWIRFLRQKNKGPAAARNAGIQSAKGEYLYFLDADDKMCKDALEIFDNAIEDEALDYVYAGHYSVKIGGKLKTLCPEPGFVDPVSDFKRLIAGKGVSPTLGTVLIHRDCFKSLSYSESLRCNEDFVLFAHLFALYQGKAIATPVVYKYKRPDSLRSESQAIIDAVEKAPGLLFDPAVLPAEYFRFKSIYVAKRYLEKARIHFKQKQFKAFRETFQQAARVHPWVLLKGRFLLRYLRSFFKKTA